MNARNLTPESREKIGKAVIGMIVAAGGVALRHLGKALESWWSARQKKPAG